MTTTRTAVLPDGSSFSLVVSVWMAIMAVGLWIPILLARSWNRASSSDDGAAARGVWVRRVRIGDELLLWPALGVLALVMGMAMAGRGFWTAPMLSLFRWLHEGFLLGAFPLAGLRLITIIALLAMPAALSSLSIACICRLAARHHNWELASVGLSATGCGAGLLLADKLSSLGVSESMMAALAALPMLTLAIVCVSRMGRPQHQPAQSTSPGPEPESNAGARSPHMARFCNIWLASSLALMMTQFARLFFEARVAAGWHAFSWPALLCAAGIGLTIGAAWRPASIPTMGGIGVAFAGAGVCAAGAIILPALLWSSPSPGGAALGLMCVSTGVTGYALAYAQRAVWRRSANRVRAGVDLLASTLAAGAIAVAVAGVISTDPRGAFACLSAVSLSLLALGGVSIIHEPDYSVRTRRWRLAGVFAVLALMMAGLPNAGRAWTRRLTTSGAVPESRMLSASDLAATL